jgi:hypothetical protein
VLLPPRGKHAYSMSRIGAAHQGLSRLSARTTISGMRTDRSNRQPDLFARAADRLGAEHAVLEAPPPEDFVARIRDELVSTLAHVREAAVMPWNDLTTATLAELRFNSITGWLPAKEADSLRNAFRTELRRLYAVTEGPD